MVANATAPRLRPHKRAAPLHRRGVAALCVGREGRQQGDEDEDAGADAPHEGGSSSSREVALELRRQVLRRGQLLGRLPVVLRLELWQVPARLGVLRDRFVDQLLPLGHALLEQAVTGRDAGHVLEVAEQCR